MITSRFVKISLAALGSLFIFCLQLKAQAIVPPPPPGIKELPWKDASEYLVNYDEKEGLMRLFDIEMDNSKSYVVPAAVKVGETYIIPWSECNEKTCRAFIGSATKKNDVFIRTKIRQLPVGANVWAVDGISFVSDPQLFDIDGDSKEEILLNYSVSENPRPAVGSRFREYITLINVQTLTTLFSAVVDAGGGDTELRCTRDIATDGSVFPLHPDLYVTKSCNVRYCLENRLLPGDVCPAPVQTIRRYPWRKLLDRYVIAK